MSNITRTKEINDLFQWSNNNSANDNLDGETGRQNRLKTTGFKGGGSGFSNSEKIHAADFNFIFHHLAKDLFNIDASITELYKFVQSNRSEINTNSRTYSEFVKRYERERTTDNGRVTALETYKESANQWTWIKNKIENSGESLELGNVKIKNKNGAVNANLNFQYGDSQTTHSLFVNGSNEFGLWNSTNGNIWKVDGAGRVNFSNDIVLGNGSNRRFIANVENPNSEYDAANKSYVDRQVANVAKTNATNTFTQPTNFNETVNFGGSLVKAEATPTQEHQVTNKKYVDNKFLNVATPTAGGHAANREYVDDKFKNVPDITSSSTGEYAANKNYVDAQARVVTNTIDAKLKNVTTPTQDSHAANKKYVDDKLLSAVRTNVQNTFTADQIIGDDMKIIFGDAGGTYSIGKESQNLKLKYGNNEIAEFEPISGELQSGTLKEYIDTRTNIGALSGLWVNDDVNTSLSSSLRLGAYRPSGSGIRPPKSKLEITKNGGTNYNWDVVTRRNGSNDRTDIAFNDNGLTTSTLKSYIDGEISKVTSRMKDYNVYVGYKNKEVTKSGTWVINFDHIPNHRGVYVLGSYNIIGITIKYIFKNDSHKTFSFSSLPKKNVAYEHTVIGTDSSGTPWAYHFKINPYNTNTTWHDFNISYIGAHKLNDGSWKTTNDVRAVEVWVSYQDA